MAVQETNVGEVLWPTSHESDYSAEKQLREIEDRVGGEHLIRKEQ